MKVLIITNGFYPLQTPRSFRATELVKEFVRQEDSVTLVCPFRQGIDEFLNEYKINYISLGELRWGKKVNRLIPKFLNRAVNRLLNVFFEFPHLELSFKVKDKIKGLSDFDLLISIAAPYPIHWGVASSFSGNLAKTWVADCGDPYMLQENDSINKPFYFKYLEKWMFKKVDYISIPTKTAINGYYPEFHNKIHIIPQGFKFQDYEYLNTEISNSKIIKFAYAGSFIPGKRDPKEFLTYLLEIENEIDFEFYIYSNQNNLINPFVEKSNKIKLLPNIPRVQLMEELSKMDFLVNFANLGKVQTPSKLIDYAILKKPILEIETFSLNKVLVNEFLNKNYKNSLIIENPNIYRIENIVDQFKKLLIN
jgi:hypothetical protein